MKELDNRQERDEAFERFEATREKEIWDQALDNRREKERNPDWRPRTLVEGVGINGRSEIFFGTDFARALIGAAYSMSAVPLIVTKFCGAAKNAAMGHQQTSKLRRGET
jgi:hypothetical protein